MRTLLPKRLKYALVLSPALAVVIITTMVWFSHAAPHRYFPITQEYAETKAGLTLRFTITIPFAPNNWAARYSYKTEDGTAKAGEDYNAVSGKIVFNSGEKTKTISIQTLSNNQNNIGAETVKLKLYNLETNGLYRVDGWYKARAGRVGWIPDEATLTGTIITNAR